MPKPANPPPNPANATLETDLAAYERRGTDLVARRDAAQARLLSAIGDRRRLLVETDNPTPAALAAADRAVRDAQDAFDAAADAALEVADRVKDLRGRIDRLATAGERDRDARIVEAVAQSIDPILARIASATADLAAARVDLAAAILPTTAPLYAPDRICPYSSGTLSTGWFDSEGTWHSDDLIPEEIASRVVGHAVSSALPGFAIATAGATSAVNALGWPTPVLAVARDLGALQEVLTTPMREHAAALRSGTASVLKAPTPPIDDLAAPPPSAPQVITPDPKGMGYLGRLGSPFVEGSVVLPAGTVLAPGAAT